MLRNFFLWFWVYVQGKYFEIFQLSTFSNLCWHWLGGNLLTPSAVRERLGYWASTSYPLCSRRWGSVGDVSCKQFPVFSICHLPSGPQSLFIWNMCPIPRKTALFQLWHHTLSFACCLDVSLYASGIHMGGLMRDLSISWIYPLSAVKGLKRQFWSLIRLRWVRWSGSILQGALPVGVNIGGSMEMLLWKCEKSAPASPTCNSDWAAEGKQGLILLFDIFMGVWWPNSIVCLLQGTHSIHTLATAWMLHSQEKVLQIWCCLQVWSAQHKSVSAMEMTWLCKWEIDNWLRESWFGPHFLSLSSILLHHKPSQQMKFSYCDMFLAAWGSRVLSFCEWIMLAVEFVNLLTKEATPVLVEKAGREESTWRTRHWGRKGLLICREVLLGLE